MSDGGEPQEDEAGFADAAAAGVHRISLPTPFLVGRVNCYLIEDEPLTLVDTGPNSAKSLDELEAGLRALGHTVKELGLIVLTHQHMDHLGAIATLADRSGAEIAAFDGLTGYLEDFTASAIADDAFSMEIMRRHGVPPDVVDSLAAVGAAFRSFGSGGEVSRPLRDGDALTLRDRALTVHHRPGHSPSDLVFADQRRAMLIAGDHLLARISSNPVVSRPLTPGPHGTSAAERPHALEDYIASMRATQRMDVTLVLGGHGAPTDDHVALVDSRLRMHERRARKVLELLSDGPLTGYEMAARMWGNVAVTQAFLTISELLGHLDLLIADGLVVEDESAPVTRFRQA
jgi:glyoxylase-like metal-dependent hydrolase (beta-lactamase superfamily II)